jgi:PHD/YefM family antitoxin component YafN of YafNO toxin-antitoxin module
MNIVSTTSARETLDRILDEAVAAHEPVLTKGARSNGVLVAEEDWKAIQKTLTLLSMPGIRGSIRQGMLTSIEGCAAEPGW